VKNLVIFVLVGVGLISCKEDDPTAPSILSIEPMADGVGAEVVIRGSKFGESFEDASVDFNGTPGFISQITDTLISASVPEGATTGKITVNIKGGTASSIDDFQVLKGRWTIMTQPPFNLKFYAVTFVINNVAYIGCGVDPPVPLKDFYAYDPANDKWTRKADIPVARYHAVSFVVGSKAYVGLGRNEVDLADFYEYDPSTDQWKQVASFPAGPRQTATAFAIGGKGYVGLGRSGAITSGDKLNKDVWAYDPVLNTWSQVTEFGGTARERAISLNVNGKGYVGLGGYNNYHDFWQFDPALGTWSPLAENPSQRNLMWDITAFALNNRIYVLGGYSKNCMEYDAASNLWQRRNSAPQSFGGGNSFSVGNHGYLIASTQYTHCQLWRFALE
jgi:N-acetylneuraminic acid mutarotase